MADNVTFQDASLATPADGTVVSTDEAASGHVQRMKLTYSGNGLDTHVPADADGLLVNLGANNDVTVAGVATAANQLPDGHNVAVASLPNEGQQTMANSISVAVASNQSAVPVSGTVAVTGVSTLAEQQSQTTHLATIAGDTTDIETAVELIDDSVATLGTTTYAEATTKGLIVGALRRDADTSAVNTDNEIAPLVVDATGKLKVEVFDGGDSHTVDQATAANLNAQVVGNIAHDTAHTGNPVTVSGTHETIADSAPANRLASVTDGDVQRLSTTDGALFVIPTGPQSWKARLTGSMSDTTVKAAPASGLSLYITDIVYSIGSASASSILLEESTTTAVFGPHYLEAIAGRGLAVHLGTPIKITAATLLSATSTGSTTNTLDVYGFTAPG